MGESSEFLSISLGVFFVGYFFEFDVREPASTGDDGDNRFPAHEVFGGARAYFVKHVEGAYDASEGAELVWGDGGADLLAIVGVNAAELDDDLCFSVCDAAANVRFLIGDVAVIVFGDAPYASKGHEHGALGGVAMFEACFEEGGAYVRDFTWM